jgi:AraC-like DNA-binding protein
MANFFPIEKIKVSDRANYWEDHLISVCGNFDTVVDDWNNFKGHIGIRNAGGFDIAEISNNANKVIRSKKHVAASNDRYCFLILQQEGSAILSQNGNEVFLEKGDMTLIDSGRPSVFQYDGFHSQISLHIPRDLLESCFPYNRIDEAHMISGSKGMGAITSRFLHSIYTEASELEAQDFISMREMLLKLLTSTLRADSAEDVIDVKQRQLKMLSTIIEQHLTDPELTPTLVATKAGISTRHLHRLFHGQNTSFGEWVRKRRLTEARRQLANTHFSDHSIIQIAFYWGFNDASHFSRVFKAQFGLSPRAYRLSKRK